MPQGTNTPNNTADGASALSSARQSESTAAASSFSSEVWTRDLDVLKDMNSHNRPAGGTVGGLDSNKDNDAAAKLLERDIDLDDFPDIYGSQEAKANHTYVKNTQDMLLRGNLGGFTDALQDIPSNRMDDVVREVNENLQKRGAGVNLSYQDGKLYVMDNQKNRPSYPYGVEIDVATGEQRSMTFDGLDSTVGVNPGKVLHMLGETAANRIQWHEALDRMSQKVKEKAEGPTTNPDKSLIERIRESIREGFSAGPSGTIPNGTEGESDSKDGRGMIPEDKHNGTNPAPPEKGETPQTGTTPPAPQEKDDTPQTGTTPAPQEKDEKSQTSTNPAPGERDRLVAPPISSEEERRKLEEFTRTHSEERNPAPPPPPSFDR